MKSIPLRKVLVVKGIIAIGLVSVYVIPPQYAPGVSVMANFLWLFWKEETGQ